MPSSDEHECPLCMEAIDPEDWAFYPCECKYQVCRFCWSKIINEENGLCPACRKKYDPDFPASNINQILAKEPRKYIANSKRKREASTKQHAFNEPSRNLADLRVVQRNLLFAVGFPEWIAQDKEFLMREELFGSFGKVYKVEVNVNQTFNGPRGTSMSAYITYERSDDAMRAVIVLDQSTMFGRPLRVSLGTTKYCSQFLRNLKCTKTDCMYLHELGDSKASFTKDDMQAGKHTEYMNELLEEFKSRIPPESLKAGSKFAPNKFLGPQPGPSRGKDKKCHSTLSSSNSVQSTSYAPIRPQSCGKTDEAIKIAPPDFKPSVSRSRGVVLSKPTVIATTKCLTATVNAPRVSTSSNTKQLSKESVAFYFPQVNNLTNGRSVNTSAPNACTDIDFDPILESQVALAQLMESEFPEKLQRQQPRTQPTSFSTQTFNHAPMHQQNVTAFPPPPPPGFEDTVATGPSYSSSVPQLFPFPPNSRLVDITAITANGHHTNCSNNDMNRNSECNITPLINSLMQQSRVQQQWNNGCNDYSNLDFLSQVIRLALRLEENSMISQSSSPPPESLPAGVSNGAAAPSVGIAAASSGHGNRGVTDRKCYGPPDSTATTSTTGLNCPHCNHDISNVVTNFVAKSLIVAIQSNHGEVASAQRNTIATTPANNHVSNPSSLPPPPGALPPRKPPSAL